MSICSRLKAALVVIRYVASLGFGFANHVFKAKIDEMVSVVYLLICYIIDGAIFRAIECEH